MVIEEQEHEAFEREDDDVYVDVISDFVTATLGGDITVQTLFGESVLSIEPGTQPGSTLRMKGKGIPHLNSKGSGDQYVRFTIYVPTKLSSNEKETLKELGKSEHFTPKDKRRRSDVFEKIKGAIS